MKIIMEVLFILGLASASCLLASLPIEEHINNKDTFHEYLDSIHTQLKQSLYSQDPAKTMEHFYRWDESIGIYKGLPCFSNTLKTYQLYLSECEIEIQACMATSTLLKEYFLKTKQEERDAFRQQAQEWCSKNFPHQFFTPPAPQPRRKKLLNHLLFFMK